MQALFTRLAQARGSHTCRCPQCLTSASATSATVSRRAAATATRRVPRYLTSSTLWYSGIFAAAATFDAGAKRQRREKWDKAIADVKGDLEVGDRRRRRGIDGEETDELVERVGRLQLVGEQQELAWPGSGQVADVFSTLDRRKEVMAERRSSASALRSLEDGTTYKPFPSHPVEIDEGTLHSSSPRIVSTPQPAEPSDAFEAIKDAPWQAYTPASTGSALNSNHVAPGSMYSTKRRQRRHEGAILSEKKVAELQLAMDMLLLSVFQELRFHGWSQEAAQAVPESFAHHFSLDDAKLQELLDTKADAHESLKYWTSRSTLSTTRGRWRDPSQSICTFHQNEENSTLGLRTVRNLNSSLRELFILHNKQALPLPALLAKLSYNLSLCTAPPDLKTFNTLLVGFKLGRQPHLLEATITALRQAHMRPNEVTLATILRHYTATSQAEAFVHWIGLLRGKDAHGQAIALAHPETRITDAGRARLRPHPRYTDRIVQLPHATPHVFGPVIEGVIKFAGFESALKICEGMGKEGWGLCIAGLTPLLVDCASRGDWAAGLGVWQQIVAVRGAGLREVGKDKSGWGDHGVVLEGYAAMLRLCSRCGKRGWFGDVWAQALRLFPRDEGRLVRMIKEQKRDVADEEMDVDWRRVDLDSRLYNVQRADDADIRAQIDTRQQQAVKQEAVIHGEDSAHTIEQKAADSSVWPEALAQPQVATSKPLAPQLKRGEPIGRSYEAKYDILEEQLWGFLPAGEQLDTYELVERPMRLTGHA